MKRGVLVGVAGAAVVIAAFAGCSSNKSSTSSSSPPSPGASASAAGPPVPAAEKVSVDGQNQNVSGAVSCVASGDNINIGIGDPTTGIGAVVTNADPPAVHSVGLGNVNGVTLGYSDAAPGQGNAQATKNGNSYNINGTATGVDMTNQQPVTKSFEINVTCP